MGKHNRWLDWKIRHGLAARGHTGIDRFHPKGLAAGILYRLYFRKRDPGRDLPSQTFKQSVGGTMGPVGKTNGE